MRDPGILIAVLFDISPKIRLIQIIIVNMFQVKFTVSV